MLHHSSVSGITSLPRILRQLAAFPKMIANTPKVAAAKSQNFPNAMATNGEAAAAKQAAESGAAKQADRGEPTIFDKIIAKEIPSTIVYEDDDALAFRDINPQAPIHILIIPKKRDGLIGLSHATERNKAVLGHLMMVASHVARSEGLSDGYRVVVNDGVNGCPRAQGP